MQREGHFGKLSAEIMIPQDCGGSQAGAGATVSTYVAGRKDGETQMIKLPGQSGGENLKATQVYDVSPCGDIKAFARRSGLLCGSYSGR